MITTIPVSDEGVADGDVPLHGQGHRGVDGAHQRYVDDRE